MHTILGFTSMTNGFFPYRDWECNNWNGNRTDCFEESPADDIFISDYSNFRDVCIIELNFGEVTNTSIQDSSGTGNIGIMFGDYSIKKSKKGREASKNSYFKLPKTSKSKGAF